MTAHTPPESRTVAIIGAGPTGCAAATYLARGGVDVVLIDRHDPPRDRLGESLLPVVAPILDELGVDMTGFKVKHGATFVRGDQAVRFPFDEAMRIVHPHAWQTPRGELDQRMRDVAIEHGVRFVHARVDDVVFSDGSDGPVTIELSAADAHAANESVRCDFVLDAGGRHQFLARKLGLTARHPWLRNAAQSGWYTGIQLQDPEVDGDIAITAFDGGWFWFIPFEDDTWSVGAVCTPDGPRGRNQFEAALALCPEAQARLANATRIVDMRGASDISVSSTAFYGDRFALLGDAATFLDPVFSTGVSLGLHAARGFAEHYLAGEPLDAWEARCRAAVEAFEPVVKCWYEGKFLDIALADGARHQATVRQAIVSLLAGDVFDEDFDAPRRFGRRFDSIHRMVTR